MPMKCPSCALPLEAPVARCPHCRFSLLRADTKFGMVPRHSRYLTDRTGRVPMSDIAQLRDALRLFEKKFPQILFSVFVDDLPKGSSAAEYAFWLSNRARFSSVEKKMAENFDLLLLVDLTTNSAALTSGYGLEASVREEDLQFALDALAGPLGAGDVAGGIRALLDALIRRLRALSKQSQTNAPRDAEVMADAS